MAEKQSRPHLLIVDDDEVSRYLLKGLLAPTGYWIAEAKDGHEGLRHARKFKPDAIILDLAMPDFSGFQVLESLKQDPETARIPVIIHTSKTLDSRERSLLHEAVEVISKNTQSREAALASFSQAFVKAGLPIGMEKPVDLHI